VLVKGLYLIFDFLVAGCIRSVAQNNLVGISIKKNTTNFILQRSQPIMQTATKQGMPMKHTV